MNALKKINARAKALKKKHPGKKYKTLQKQAGAEYRAGKLKTHKKRKPAAKKVARKKVTRKKTAVRKVAKVASLGTVIKKRRKLKPRKVKVKAYRATRYKVSGMGKDLLPIVALGGLALLAYKMLVPSQTVPQQYLNQLQYSNNANRNTSAQNILAYATAAGMTASAIAALINAINNSSDDEVTAAGAGGPGSVNLSALRPPASSVYG